jgi:hypothetical protein
MMTCMKPTMLCAAIFISSLWTCAGCSYTYTVTFEEEKSKGNTVSVATLNNRLGGRSSTIVMHNGKEHTALVSRSLVIPAFLRVKLGKCGPV